MNRPSFQFYPADWLGNSNLRRCSHAEKGVWIDVMCLMHDSEEYGILRWSLKEIAQAIGCKLADLKSLISKGVLKGDDKHLSDPLVYVPVSGRKKGPAIILIEEATGPIWYSSRMVIDEYKRNVRGGFGDTPNHAPKGTNGECINDAPNPSPSHAGAPRAAVSSSSSSSVKPKTQVSSSSSNVTTVVAGNTLPPLPEPSEQVQRIGLVCRLLRSKGVQCTPDQFRTKYAGLENHSDDDFYIAIQKLVDRGETSIGIGLVAAVLGDMDEAKKHPGRQPQSRPHQQSLAEQNRIAAARAKARILGTDAITHQSEAQP